MPHSDTSKRRHTRESNLEIIKIQKSCIRTHITVTEREKEKKRKN